MNVITIRNLRDQTIEGIARLAALLHDSVEADAAAKTPKGVMQSHSTLLIQEGRDR